jgi:alanyl-tRNA synthetase
VDLETQALIAEVVGGVNVVIKRVDLPQRELSALASSVAARGGVALVGDAGDTARVVLASGDLRVNAGEIIGQVCELLGGKGGGKPNLAQGGGPETGKLDLALKVGRERILAALNG